MTEIAKLPVKGISAFKGLAPGVTPEPKAVRIQYRKPETLDHDRGIVPLVSTDIMFAGVQVIAKGGEQEDHSHAGMDGFWFVLKGRAEFYGAGNELICEAGPMEGVFVPRHARYWFRAVGDEVLELLQVEAIDRTVKNTQTRYSKPKTGTLEVFDQAGQKIDEGFVDIEK